LRGTRTFDALWFTKPNLHAHAGGNGAAIMASGLERPGGGRSDGFIRERLLAADRVRTGDATRSVDHDLQDNRRVTARTRWISRHEGGARLWRSDPAIVRDGGIGSAHEEDR
jgi:hypothetical protein